MIIHTVKRGQTLFSIASQYGVPIQRLIRDNGLRHPDALVVGQTLVVLYPSLVHTVLPGESLFSIAKQYGVSVRQLYRNNPGLVLEDVIYPGQTVVIFYEESKLGAMDVNGYAYPYIDRQLLRETLPFMTYLMPFTYEIAPNGELGGLDDTELVSLAKTYGTAPLLNLSNLREPVGFDSDIAHNVLTNPSIQARVIDETYEMVHNKGYAGVDIDFEYLYKEDALPLAQFIGRLREKLAPEGYEVFAALTAKSSSEMTGRLFEGHDYSAVGNAADAVLLMTYEWGYRFGPPMAIAPIGNVRAVLDYAVTQMPPEKIFVGVPNYGYDWPLPFVQGVTEARSLSNEYAISLAREYGAEIQYSTSAQSPYFRYQAGNKVHEVWFEDARSIQAKLGLVAEYGLRGAGYWNLMRPFPENWTVLNALYQVNQVSPFY